MIDGKRFFEAPIKNKEEAYKRITEIGRNDDHITGNLLDYKYFSKHYKLIAIDWSKQIELENPDLKQQINFLADQIEIMELQCSLSLKNQNKTFEFSQNAATVV